MRAQPPPLTVPVPFPPELLPDPEPLPEWVASGVRSEPVLSGDPPLDPVLCDGPV